MTQEVNFSPSLNVDGEIDLNIKSRMLAELFTLAGITPYDITKKRDEYALKALNRANSGSAATTGASSSVINKNKNWDGASRRRGKHVHTYFSGGATIMFTYIILHIQLESRERAQIIYHYDRI